MNDPHGEKRFPLARGGESTVAVVTLLWAGLVWLLRPPQRGPLRWLLAPLTAVWLIILYFFRDPERQGPQEPGLVVSPGDGKVVAIVDEFEDHYLHAPVKRISIFLSLLDVHVQRVPIGGRVSRIEHRAGQFLQAFRPEASEVNENIAMVIETPYGPVLVKQIAGILARRCVNYLHVGDRIVTGQRFGLIRFSSRVDLFLPPQAEILVSVGDRVIGGITPVARLTAAHNTG